jgi:sulfur-oxidizing protein SoxY
MRRSTLAAALSLLLTLPGMAPAASWDMLRGELYAGRDLLPAGDSIAIDSPYRSQNDARTLISARIAGPEGRLIDRVTVILDENPMPVSAVFDLATPLPRFFFELTLRFNGPTPLHIVAETTDGQAYMAEAFVKTSGQGACAAPPGTDPEEALATLGDMTIDLAPLAEAAGDAATRLTALAGRDGRLDVDVMHPSLSGLQMDQITMLFIPMRYVERLAIELDGRPYAEVTGSITLSENPRISLSAPSGTRDVDVTMTDTNGTVTHAHRAFPGY